MTDTISPETPDIEEILEAQAHGGALKRAIKKPDATGLAYYGGRFTGYQKIEEYRDLIPAFKELYYERMIADTNAKLTHILREFDDSLQDIPVGEGLEGQPIYRKFHPNTSTVRRWKAKWNKDILEKKGLSLELTSEKKHVQQVITTQHQSDNPNRQYSVPQHESLEAGLQTFGGELMNDAMQMLSDDQAMEEVYETDELIKRRNYMVGVFSHVTKMVHGKATLMLKASADKREEAHFLMDLMGQASAGNVSLEEIQELKKSYEPKQAPIHAESIVT